MTPESCRFRVAELRKRLPCNSRHRVPRQRARRRTRARGAIDGGTKDDCVGAAHTAYTAYRDERLPVLTAAHPLATKLELDSRMQTGWRRLDAVSMEALHARAAAANSIAPRSVLQKVEVLPPKVWYRATSGPTSIDVGQASSVSTATAAANGVTRSCAEQTTGWR